MINPTLAMPARALERDLEQPRERTTPPPKDLGAAYDRHATGMYRFILVRVGHDQHLAADLMQQLWVALATTGRNVPENEIEFWLRGVARNMINTHWRRVSNRPAHVPVPDESIASDLADRMTSAPLGPEYAHKREVRDQLILAITELSSSDQELIYAHYIEGVQQVDLVERLGISARAIEGRLYRARQALRDRLKHLNEPDGS